MKAVTQILCVLTMVLVCSAKAQSTEVITQPITVSFKNIDHPLEVRITKPEGFDEGDKSRGFKRVKKRIVLFEGYINDENGVVEARLNDELVALDPDGFFALKLSFTPGDHELKFTAKDQDGYVGEKSYFFSVEEETERLVSGNYHALIIGVDEYEDNRIVDLDRPISDATALKNILIDKYTFVEENVTLLSNATRRDIIDELDKLSERITEDDNLLIFYAGHGYWDEDKEIGYWIPSDARQTSTADWFRNTTLTDQIRSIRSKHTLLVADACFSGTIFKARSAVLEADKAIQLKYSLPSRKAMTSGTLTQVPDRSAFMKYLLKRLGDNNERYLAANSLFYSMEDAVINNSDEGVKPQYGTIQKVGDEGGDFIFILKDLD